MDSAAWMGRSQTPFIDAKVVFLKEFIEDETRRPNGVGFSSSSRSGRGKHILCTPPPQKSAVCQ
jgi:hypothetical protein